MTALLGAADAEGLLIPPAVQDAAPADVRSAFGKPQGGAHADRSPRCRRTAGSGQIVAGRVHTPNVRPGIACSACGAQRGG
jgi:hypothetical protein